MNEDHPNQHHEQPPEQAQVESAAEQLGLVDGEFTVMRKGNRGEDGWSVVSSELEILKPGEEPVEVVNLQRNEADDRGRATKKVLLKDLLSWQESEVDNLGDDTVPRDKLQSNTSAPQPEKEAEDTSTEPEVAKNVYSPEAVVEIRSELDTLERDIQHLEAELITEAERFQADAGQLSEDLRSGVLKLESEVNTTGRQISNSLHESINMYKNLYRSLEYGDGVDDIAPQAERIREDIAVTRNKLEAMHKDVQGAVAVVRGTVEAGADQAARGSYNIRDVAEDIDLKSHMQRTKLRDLAENSDSEGLQDEYVDLSHKDARKSYEREDIKNAAANLRSQFMSLSEAVASGELEQSVGASRYVMAEMEDLLGLLERQLGDIVEYSRSMSSSQIAANFGHSVMARMRELENYLQIFAVKRQNFEERIPQI